MDYRIFQIFTMAVWSYQESASNWNDRKQVIFIIIGTNWHHMPNEKSNSREDMLSSKRIYSNAAAGWILMDAHDMLRAVNICSLFNELFLPPSVVSGILWE